MDDDPDLCSASGDEPSRDRAGGRAPADRPAPGSRAGRTSAAVLGAAAMLVLSFGPSALALSPSSTAPAPQTSRVVTSASALGPAAAATARSEDSPEADAQDEVDAAG
ncbi:hypothetical protein ACT3SP_07160 [Brachybacterium sp. AOP43-C2-M15]|uniref:hypothetical protein n=1 Tax=Brachybacterium sp. AOP43-C2-M15 TaxID=3457661 RepID=UPI0040341B45